MRARFTAAVATCVFLASCATSYGPRGITGGYKEDQFDDHTYAVYFYGNGNTSGDTVWYYWIYRCAELTKQKGFTAFTIIKPSKQADADADQNDVAEGSMPDRNAAHFIKTRGHGGGTYYYYVPGHTITTYSAGAVVSMFKKPYPVETRFLLDAEKIIQALRPYIDAEGKIQAPARDEILKDALITVISA